MSNLMEDNNPILEPLTRESKPTYIHEQHNSNCQQFFGPLYGCVFAMPGSHVDAPVIGKCTGVGEKSAAKTDTALESPTKIPVSKKAAKVKTAKKKSETSTNRELMTFSKGAILDAHIKILCLDLMKDGWMAAGTNDLDFLELFSGERSECSFVWTGKFGKGTLVYLFCELYAEGLIDIANGYTLAHILEGHFTDKEGKYLTNLDHGDPYNEQAVPMVKEYIRKMKTSIGHMRHHDEDDYDDLGYDDRLDYSDRTTMRVRNRG